MRKKDQLTSKTIRYALILRAIDQCSLLMAKFGYSRSSISTACISVDIAYQQIGYIEPKTNTYYFNPPYYSHTDQQRELILSMSIDRYLQLLVSKTKEVLLKKQYLRFRLSKRLCTESLEYTHNKLEASRDTNQCHSKTRDLFKYGIPERKPEQTLSEYVNIFTKQYRSIPRPLTSVGRRKPAWR